MNEINKISSVYFLGIGGIGMSALARYFNSKGTKVSGYDKTETVLTKQLILEGIDVHYDDNIEKLNRSAELIVYTPAIPKDHTELLFAMNNALPLKKRSEVLGLITRSTFSICVAGTHGKTTTSCMIAHILTHTGYGCNAFLGGIASNYNTNFWSNEKNVSVAEADEYDRSFLQLNPDIAVVTSMDADHLDIYGTGKNLQDAFISFTEKIKSGGLLVYKYGLQRSSEFKSGNYLTYSLTNKSADVTVSHIRILNGSYHFAVKVKDHQLNNLTLNMGGMHNIENALAAIAIANQLGINDSEIQKAVESFRGVKRRFEYVIKTEQLVLIDDYAHHPEELRALINGAKELFPGKKCTVVFQPHLFSRTNDFADGFAEVLSLADDVILLPIYPARELPMPGVNSEMIATRMTNKNVRVIQKDKIVSAISNQELLIVCGAGDIDTLVEPIKQELLKNQKQ